MQMNWVFNIRFVTLTSPQTSRSRASRACFSRTRAQPNRNSAGYQISAPLQRSTSSCAGCRIAGRDMPCGKRGVTPSAQAKVRRSEITTYCGTIKHHPPTELGVSSASLDNAPDIFQAAEWSDGGSAWRQTIVSQRFADLLSSRRWRGARAAHPLGCPVTPCQLTRFAAATAINCR